MRDTPMRGPRERLVHSIHVLEALTHPAENEQLEPFIRYSRASAGASEVNNSEV